MGETDLKERLTKDMNAALKAGEKQRLGIIRLINAAVKQREIDSRSSTPSKQTALDDQQVIAVLDKMAKQRRESIDQFQRANRNDLVAQEEAELAVILDYLPSALSDAEIDAAIQDAITAAGAESIRDMGKVMGQLKPKMQGRADMAQVSARVKSMLSQT